MLSLGIDLGSSSVKCCLWDVSKGVVLASGQHPATEMEMRSPQPGWAEQDPNVWWDYVVLLTRKLLKEANATGDQVRAIGIAYQMHGLVVVDASGTVLRPSIIWCDSRAVETGEAAAKALGAEYCRTHLLNSPGNFTASKLRWVRDHEPATYEKIHKAMLPGDYVAMRMTGEMTTTVSGLTEGIFWDFARAEVSRKLMEYYDINPDLLAAVKPTFGVQGVLSRSAASELGLSAGTPVAYRAGDQPNNALSLNVLEPGEVAATAGTSGVVFAVTESVVTDPESRVNVFAHVNHSTEHTRLGMLLCINGTGILNSWLHRNVAADLSYDAMNSLAASSPVGAGGLKCLPFGNGAERMLGNATVGCHLVDLDFQRHTRADVLRASQEGLAFSFRYGTDIIRSLGIPISIVRAGTANLFLSPLFCRTVATVLGATVELFKTDGAQGAARGGAIGAGLYTSPKEAFASLSRTAVIDPVAGDVEHTTAAYHDWLHHLELLLERRGHD
ncbi:MAG TPA: FGGY family carbohydrate kinase [Bacteroidota bacterium]|nr:FGGY family carbohydrate kinase [Bacteroidota bacterium]